MYAALVAHAVMFNLCVSLFPAPLRQTLRLDTLRAAVADSACAHEASGSATDQVPQEQWRALATELCVATAARARALFSIFTTILTVVKVQNVRRAAAYHDPRTMRSCARNVNLPAALNSPSGCYNNGSKFGMGK